MNSSDSIPTKEQQKEHTSFHDKGSINYQQQGILWPFLWSLDTDQYSWASPHPLLNLAKKKAVSHTGDIDVKDNKVNT